MKNKIGIGVITCNRQDFFKKCLNSLPNVDTIVVINDGQPYPNDVYGTKAKEVIQHSKNKCVGISKNEALRYLIQDGCDHLFLVEDDMLIVNQDVCKAYIHGAEKSGIWHLNFAYHGPGNITPDGKPAPRATIDYDDVKLSFNPNCVGSFSYYLKSVIKHVGYIDERYINCWDHVEHTYRIIKAGLHPPFWWFADLANSLDYINEQASSTVSTTITRTPEWVNNFHKGAAWFKHKHNYIPTQIPMTEGNEVLKILEQIKTNYARNVL